MSDHKSTPDLPETVGSMRGDLAKREPGMLARWTDDDLYGIIRATKRQNHSVMMALHAECAFIFRSLC